MAVQATESRKAVHVICDNCQRSLTITDAMGDEQVRQICGGWTFNPRLNTCSCPSCYLINPYVEGLLPINQMFDIATRNDRGPVHGYNGNGPPGLCRLCGQLINERDIWLDHSQNYVKVPAELQKFPAHKQCWIDKTARYLEHVHIYDEHWKMGW